MPEDDLPDDFLSHVRALEPSYLSDSDPIRQSGFGGGPERWRAERSPILQAIDRDGDLLDVGCANGYLLECLVAWGEERGVRLTPHGVDIGPRLVAAARERFPGREAHFHVGNAWDWLPPRRYDFVYAIYDCVPESHLAEWASRLLDRVVAAGGRLIMGAYGSRSRGRDPFDIAGFLTTAGLQVVGTAAGGTPPITAFAWVDG